MVQTEILEKHPQAQIQVYAVWFNMLYSDSRETWPSDVLPDPRVTHFWDEERIAGKWFAKNISGLPPRATWGGIAWDIYFLYGPEAQWHDAPQPLLIYGRTIVTYFDQLIEKIIPLLG